jgi:hypothetical protein
VHPPQWCFLRIIWEEEKGWGLYFTKGHLEEGVPVVAQAGHRLLDDTIEGRREAVSQGAPLDCYISVWATVRIITANGRSRRRRVPKLSVDETITGEGGAAPLWWFMNCPNVGDTPNLTCAQSFQVGRERASVKRPVWVLKRTLISTGPTTHSLRTSSRLHPDRVELIYAYKSGREVVKARFAWPSRPYPLVSINPSASHRGSLFWQWTPGSHPREDTPSICCAQSIASRNNWMVATQKQYWTSIGISQLRTYAFGEAVHRVMGRLFWPVPRIITLVLPRDIEWCPPTKPATTVDWLEGTLGLSPLGWVQVKQEPLFLYARPLEHHELRAPLEVTFPLPDAHPSPVMDTALTGIIDIITACSTMTMRDMACAFALIPGEHRLQTPRTGPTLTQSIQGHLCALRTPFPPGGECQLCSRVVNPESSRRTPPMATLNVDKDKTYGIGAAILRRAVHAATRADRDKLAKHLPPILTPHKKHKASFAIGITSSPKTLRQHQGVVQFTTTWSALSLSVHSPSHLTFQGNGGTKFFPIIICKIKGTPWVMCPGENSHLLRTLGPKVTQYLDGKHGTAWISGITIMWRNTHCCSPTRGNDLHTEPQTRVTPMVGCAWGLPEGGANMVPRPIHRTMFTTFPAEPHTRSREPGINMGMEETTALGLSTILSPYIDFWTPFIMAARPSQHWGMLFCILDSHLPLSSSCAGPIPARSPNTHPCTLDDENVAVCPMCPHVRRTQREYMIPSQGKTPSPPPPQCQHSRKVGHSKYDPEPPHSRPHGGWSPLTPSAVSGTF